MEHAGITSEELGHLISKNPRILSMSIPSNLEPKFEWIQEMGVPFSKMGGLLKAYPLLLSYSLPKLQQGQAVLKMQGVSDADMGSVLMKCPHLFGLTTDKIESNSRALADTLSLSPHQLAEIITKYPRALTYSLCDNLAPKLAYFKSVMRFDEEELSEEIVAFPLILGYSLDKRIRARHEHLIKCDIAVFPRSTPRPKRTTQYATQSPPPPPPRPAAAVGSVRAVRGLKRGGGGGGGVEVQRHDEEKVSRRIGVRSMLTPCDDVFYARYRVPPTLLHWLAHGTINYDPYGVVPEQEQFSIDIAHLH